MANYIIYAIPNCNTVKKAIHWLKDNNIEFEFHDYKKKGITLPLLTSWCEQMGWEILLNKKGTTWKLLKVEEQEKVVNQKMAIELMLEKTSLLKRPIITKGSAVILVGFDEVAYKKALT